MSTSAAHFGMSGRLVNQRFKHADDFTEVSILDKVLKGSVSEATPSVVLITASAEDDDRKEVRCHVSL